MLKDVQSFFLKDYEDYRLHKVEIHINFMLSTAAIKETWLSKGEGELFICYLLVTYGKFGVIVLFETHKSQ